MGSHCDHRLTGSVPATNSCDLWTILSPLTDLLRVAQRENEALITEVMFL